MEQIIDDTYKGKLYLTSGGYINGQRSDELDEIFKACSQKGCEVLFVDNATLTGSNKTNISVIMKNFEDNGALVRQITLNKDNLNILFDFDVVYITGGDLTPLIELANNSNLKDVILDYLTKGGIVFGESAGSMIFGEDLKWAYDVKRGTKAKWNVELSSYKGLGLVDVNFYPHWNKANEEQQEKVNRYAEIYEMKISAVSDGKWLEYNIKDLLMRRVKLRMNRLR